MRPTSIPGRYSVPSRARTGYHGPASNHSLRFPRQLSTRQRHALSLADLERQAELAAERADRASWLSLLLAVAAVVCCAWIGVQLADLVAGWLR